jgi:hypothetical protein
LEKFGISSKKYEHKIRTKNRTNKPLNKLTLQT